MSETIVGSLVEHGDLHTLMTTNGTHHINFSLLPVDDPGCAYPARIELSASGQPIVLFEGDTKYTPWSNYLDLVNGGGYQVRIDDLFNGNPVEQVLAQLKPKPKKRAVQIEAPASREDEYVDYAALIADELQNRFANHDKSSDWRHQPEAMLALSDAILNNNDRPDWYGIVAATGTGKTHMQQMLLETAQAVGAKHCIYVTSNIDLVPKTQRDFDKHGYQRREAHFYTRKTKIHPDTDIIYTLYDSLPTLLDEMKSRGITPPLIIADEGDNLRMRRGKVLDHELLQNESMLVTFTATPGITPGQRLVDLDIPTIYNFDINEGMQRDVLSHARIYRYFHDRTKMSDTDAILNIAPIRFMDPKTGELKQTLIQASSIDEANELYFKLMSDPMYSEVRHRIAIAHSRTNSEVPEDYQHAVANEFVWQLDDAVQGLNNQTVDWLIVVNKGIVGIDAPTLEVVYKRMMMSDTKPYQAIGRAARKNPFNPDATFDIVTSYPVPNPEAMGYPTELLLFGLKEYEPGCVYRGNAADYNRQIAVARAQNRVEEDETPDGLALIRYGGEVSINGAGVDLVDYMNTFPQPQDLVEELELAMDQYVGDFMNVNYGREPELSEIQEALATAEFNPLACMLALANWADQGLINPAIQTQEDLINIIYINRTVEYVNSLGEGIFGTYEITGSTSPYEYMQRLTSGVRNALQRIVREHVDRHGEYLLAAGGNHKTSTLCGILGNEIAGLNMLLELIQESDLTTGRSELTLNALLAEAEAAQGVERRNIIRDLSGLQSLRAYLFARLDNSNITDLTDLPRTSDRQEFMRIFGMTPQQVSKLSSNAKAAEERVGNTPSPNNIFFDIAMDYDPYFSYSMGLYWDTDTFYEDNTIARKEPQRAFDDIVVHYQGLVQQNAIPDEYYGQEITTSNFFEIFPAIASTNAVRMPRYLATEMDLYTNPTLNNYCKEVMNIPAAEFLQMLNTALGLKNS